MLSPEFQDFVTFFLSIVIESLPFVVLGVSISIFVALFVSDSFITKLIAKNRYTSHAIIALFGIFIPVCQCGNVPVARRLMMQGLSVSQATTFLLAAPIVNPITFITTWEAFRTDHWIAIIRILAGLFFAYIVGILMSFNKNSDNVLTQEFIHECKINHRPKKTLISALDIFQREFILIFQMLCIGAAVAAAIQVAIPRNTILSIGQNPYISILTMLALGFVVSICSNVDAFFALSFASFFSVGSILTFLIFGPLADIKMLFIMKSMYKTKWLLLFVTIIGIYSAIIGLVINVFHIL